MNPFDAAAEFYRTHRWIRGRMFVGHPGHPDGACLQGALAYVNSGAARTSFYQDWLGRFILARLTPEQITPVVAEHIMVNGCRGCLVAWWNDRIARDLDEVLELLAAASEAWELEQTMAGESAPEPPRWSPHREHPAPASDPEALLKPQWGALVLSA